MANPLVEEAKAALKGRPRAVPSSEAKALEGGLSSHPMFADALETLQLQKKLDPAKYNELVNKYADEIAGNIRMQLPGGKKGISYPVGADSSKIYFTDAKGNLQWVPRARAAEIPEGAKVHNLTREDVVRELGGMREVPAAPKPTVSAAASEDEAIQAALDATRARQAERAERAASPEEGIYAEAEATRRAQEARQAAPAATAAPSSSVPTGAYEAASGPWGTAATKSPMPSLLNDQAYAAWLKDVNRRANDLTQAGAAAGAGALYYRGLPNKAGEPSPGEIGGFSPRQDQPAPYSAGVNYSPITDTAKDVLRQRVNAPMPGSYAGNEGRGEYNPVLGPVAPTDEGRSEYDSILGSSVNAGRGSAPGMTLDQLSKTIASSEPARSASSSARNIPVPAPRPATEAGNQSIISSIFDRLKPRDPYAGMSRQDMAAKAQEMQRSGDEYGANLLTQRLDRGIISPEQQSSDGGFKRGGTAKAGGMNGKDAALHKALDIIHSMLTRR